MKPSIRLAFASVVLCVSFVSMLSPRIGAQERPAGRILVRFVDGTPAQERLATLGAHGLVGVGKVYGDDVWVARPASGPSTSQVIADLERAANVRYAERDVVLRATVAPPNDPLFGQQYAHTKISSVAGWTAHPNAYRASGGVKIAVIDTGIDTDHADLVGHIDTANSRCFGLLCLNGYQDDNGHGTHTAGTAAAAANNGTGIAGVAFDSPIIALKVCNLLGTCNTSDVASAINWARTHGAKVVSMSLGGGATSTLQSAVTAAYTAGLVLVASAGNDGDGTLNYPAAYGEVISVAATDSNDARASFSNVNADVEVAAPGVNVLATYNNGGYTTLSGTSMSAPHVAGLAALLASQNPSWSNLQIRDRMNACSDDLGAPGRDPQFGFGRINLARALGAC